VAAPQSTEPAQVQAYYADTYLTEASAAVIATGIAGEPSDGATWVAVSPNIFHPKGGGQPSDEGTLDGAPVTPARDDDRGLVVLAGAPAGLEVGDAVVCSVDAGKRRLHAALHTAGHVLGALGEARGWQHSGHSHFPGQARLDFDPEGHEDELATPELREAVRAELQSAMDATLARGGAVTASVDDGGHRTVTIDGVNSEPCGGTHVRSLADLATVRILEVKVKRGAIKVRYEAEHAEARPAP
jgi:Ser-tRNA(Ala) deacylase AlaX